MAEEAVLERLGSPQTGLVRALDGQHCHLECHDILSGLLKILLTSPPSRLQSNLSTLASHSCLVIDLEL
jgi:hypothetical protein